MHLKNYYINKCDRIPKPAITGQNETMDPSHFIFRNNENLISDFNSPLQSTQVEDHVSQPSRVDSSNISINSEVHKEL